MCNDIGEASYTVTLVAAALVLRIRHLPDARRVMARMRTRYSGVDPGSGSPEDYLLAVAEVGCLGDVERACMRLLRDYRRGDLGAFALELPVDVMRKRAREAAAVGGGAGGEAAGRPMAAAAARA